MRAIPPRLLGSGCTVRVPVDGGDDDAFAEPVAVSPVRYDTASAIDPVSYRLTDGAKGLLFVDARNSAGAFEIPEGSLVSVDGRPDDVALKVTRFETFFGEVHHWEVELG